jgi:hypothetical protein
VDIRNSRPGVVSVSVTWRCLARDSVGCAPSQTASTVAGDGGQSHLFAIVMSALELRRRTGAAMRRGGWCGMGLRDLVFWGVAGKMHDSGQPRWLIYLTLGYSCTHAILWYFVSGCNRGCSKMALQKHWQRVESWFDFLDTCSSAGARSSTSAV